LAALADRLIRLSADDSYLDGLVDEARRQAWDEVGGSIAERTEQAWSPRTTRRISAAERERRTSLVLDDLEDLAREHRTAERSCR
ncbi:hypothetical protein, partial [Mesorhizobium japonicum]|uniref:hypothetical protein n=1 Tax=Mesorhizobium japonicum TaxID=2066070 RepID=UPI003B5A17F4